MKKMTGSMILASALTLGSIAVPSILAATTTDSTTEEISQDDKAALEEIRAQEDAGEITHEEAHAKMEDLGIDRPFGKGGHHRKGPFGNIDEETRNAIEEIRDQFKAGDLTEAEAQAKLDALDVQLPEDFLTHVHFEDLDDETKAALTEIRKQFVAGDLTEAEAQAKLDALDVQLPEDFLTHVHFEDLDDETKAALTEIREQFVAGDLTEAEAQAKVEALGLDFDAKIVITWTT